MVDPGTGLAILGTAIGSAKLVEKVLGPTADYLGVGLKDWTEKRYKNVQKIFERADKLLGEDQNPNDAVPPRVLRDVLQDGSFREDEIAASYYGGILASSKSGISRDDRGAYLSSMINRLSTYQLRAHYILYSSVKNVFVDEPHNLQHTDGREACKLFIPFDDYFAAMQPEEGENQDALITHVFFGLSKESLIEPYFSYGSAEHLKTTTIEKDGIIFSPSTLGVELFLWATGFAKTSVTDFLSSQWEPGDIGIPTCTNAQRCK